jgi:hypothetical protein
MYWDKLQHLLPAQFKISLVAVVPPAGRRGRIILDLSFPVHVSKPGKRRKGEVIQEAVNITSKQLAPKAAVKEIVKVLQALFEFMASTPANKAILFSKIDLSDGFWRMIVDRDKRWNFCYIMPDPPGSRVRIAASLYHPPSDGMERVATAFLRSHGNMTRPHPAARQYQRKVPTTLV